MTAKSKTPSLFEKWGFDLFILVCPLLRVQKDYGGNSLSEHGLQIYFCNPNSFPLLGIKCCNRVYRSQSVLGDKSDRVKEKNLSNYQNFIKNFRKYQGLNFDGFVRSRLPLAGGKPTSGKVLKKLDSRSLLQRTKDCPPILLTCRLLKFW